MEQTTLGKELGITSQAVNQWAVRGTQPRGARLKRIAEVLDVSPADLMLPPGAPFRGRDGAIDPEQHGEFIHEPEEIRLIQIWRLLPEDIKAAMIQLALAASRAGQREPGVA